MLNTGPMFQNQMQGNQPPSGLGRIGVGQSNSSQPFTQSQLQNANQGRSMMGNSPFMGSLSSNQPSQTAQTAPSFANSPYGLPPSSVNTTSYPELTDADKFDSMKLELMKANLGMQTPQSQIQNNFGNFPLDGRQTAQNSPSSATSPFGLPPSSIFTTSYPSFNLGNTGRSIAGVQTTPDMNVANTNQPQSQFSPMGLAQALRGNPAQMSQGSSLDNFRIGSAPNQQPNNAMQNRSSYQNFVNSIIGNPYGY